MPHSSRYRRAADAEWVILDLLLERTHPWRVGELIDELGSPIAVAEALEALQASGLTERKDALVRIAPM
jgi:DNA-binding HxlR family transcriptional regulator